MTPSRYFFSRLYFVWSVFFTIPYFSFFYISRANFSVVKVNLAARIDGRVPGRFADSFGGGISFFFNILGVSDLSYNLSVYIF